MSNKAEEADMKPKPRRALAPELRFPEFRDTGEWEEKEVGKIFKVTRGEVLSMSLVTSEKIESHQYPVYSSQTKNNGLAGFYSDYLFEDAITWTTDGANAGDVNYRKGKFFCTNVCGVLLNNDGYVNSCVAALINSVSKKHVSYVGNPKLMNGVMAKIVIPFPLIPEQQKIADCLSSIDDLITLEARKIDALKAHKKGLMQQLFPAEGETLPKLRFPEFRNAGEWAEKKLGEVCHIFQGYGFPEALQGKQNGKFPFFKVSDISKAVNERNGLLGESANYVDDSDLSKLRAKPIPTGATVFAKIGEALRLNRRAITTLESLIDNNAVGLKAKNILVDDYFIYTLSQLIDMNEYCGGAVPSVNKSTLEGIVVSIPRVSEQQKIADCLCSIDELISLEARKIDALKDHKKGLMQQLFPSIDEASI